MPVWLALAAAYVIGSLDFAVVVARAHGIDIREVGSGNPGTSNVLRTLGRGPAAMVLLGDALKGVVAAALGWWAGGGGDFAISVPGFAAVFFAVVGHCYPLFHRFKGGKGVATGAGGFLFLLPEIALPLALVWVVLARVTKVASISSLTVVVLTAPLAWWAGVRGAAFWWLLATLLLIVWRHRRNVERMIRGAEEKVPT